MTIPGVKLFRFELKHHTFSVITFYDRTVVTYRLPYSATGVGETTLWLMTRDSYRPVRCNVYRIRI